jgi:hypothetical protein
MTFYPIYKCKACGVIETDYQDGRKNLYNHDMRLQSNTNKIHVCAKFEGCKNFGVMEHIGVHQRDDE